MRQTTYTLPVPPRVTQLLLDSNLLLILAVGKLEPHRLGRDARLKAYTSADYELLRAYSAMFPTRVTTPHTAIGLTDTAILLAARPKTVVMTSDRRLWVALVKQGRNALHYSDIMRR